MPRHQQSGSSSAATFISTNTRFDACNKLNDNMVGSPSVWLLCGFCAVRSCHIPAMPVGLCRPWRTLLQGHPSGTSAWVVMRITFFNRSSSFIIILMLRDRPWPGPARQRDRGCESAVRLQGFENVAVVRTTRVRWMGENRSGRTENRAGDVEDRKGMKV